MSRKEPARLKVLHVAQTAQGGVGSYLEEIIPLQAALYGHDAIRVVLPAEHAAAFPGLSPDWLLTFSASGTGRFLSTLRMTVLAVRAVRRWRPEVVHLHSTFAGLAMRPVLRMFGGEPIVIYCAHGWCFERRGTPLELRLFRWLERVLSKLCHHVVCVSRTDYERGGHAGIRSAKMSVVLNGIADQLAPDASRCSPFWPGTGLKILFVGRLDAQKGVDVLFGAMRKLGAGAFAVVVGSSIAGHDPAHQVPSNVRTVGWLGREQIKELYASAEVLVMPSRWEGLPLVALEAMRAGLPVIATRVGGIPEAVQDGVTGRLVELDAPSELASVLAGLDAGTLARMGVNARRRYLEAFQVQRVVHELDALYRKLRSA
jgi:glycosyltransferase involved in cell wall biosynthesis